MGAHLVEIENTDESFWLAAEFLMTGIITLNTKCRNISTFKKKIFDIDNILQTLKAI